MKINRLLTTSTTLIGLIIITIFILVAVLSPLITPYDSYKINLEERLQAPNLRHFCGTDNLGRDIFSRILSGAKISLAVGIIATFLSLFIGFVIGTLGGYIGGKTDKLIIALIDIMLAFPGLLLAIGIAVAIGPGLITLYIALSFVGWAEFARLIRGVVLSVKEQPYIESAKVAGAGNLRIVIKHILPNIFPVIIVVATLRVGSFILSEASLSFLGLGAQPPTPSWGSIVSTGSNFILTAPWFSILPGMAIAIVVIGFNLLGDGLRDIFDPKLIR
ncbi:MAG: ABC transporter permease [bacterium]|nr:ABC transporter permease [bacterium]